MVVITPFLRLRCSLNSLFIASCFFSCTTPTNSAVGTKKEITKASLRLLADQDKCAGICVIQRKTRTKFTFFLPEKARRFLIRTCHREVVIDAPPKDVPFEFIPAPFLENFDECGLEAIVTTQQGNVAVAMVEFSSNETLQAAIWCDGKASKSSLGVSLCQSRTGLVQRIQFDEPVIVESGAGCNPVVPEKMMLNTYTWETSSGLCVYSFLNTKDDNKFHRLVTRGYDTIPSEVIVDSQPKW